MWDFLVLAQVSTVRIPLASWSKPKSKIIENSWLSSQTYTSKNTSSFLMKDFWDGRFPFLQAAGVTVLTFIFEGPSLKIQYYLSHSLCMVIIVETSSEAIASHQPGCTHTQKRKKKKYLGNFSFL